MGEDVYNLHELDHVTRRARDQHDVIVHAAVAISVAWPAQIVAVPFVEAAIA